ncbi:MAG: hypothetical protein F4029_09315 [Gammaproteobacteria bacterium]|nr:hypothetical protein [Gammaproteobacteria bacterium]MYF31511.1 hypothetical protein [Gammaproteobacteria bacterium]MYK46415.1 hypothetical protein [Gammaproteobacteria bacterium]
MQDDTAGRTRFPVSSTFNLPRADIQQISRHRRVEHDPSRHPPLLVRQKVMLPDPVDGFVERFPLESRCDLTKWRVTALNAPGGFGKTTLLAEACRRLLRRGHVVAWLTVDEDDGPNGLATYLSLALAEAGVEILDSRLTSQDLQRSDYRINLLLHSIEMLGERCVLALDDVHRLRNPETMAVLNRLLQHAPPNLHVALAFRGMPAGLDVATAILQGRGISITAEELRFEKPDIARFFGAKLSRAELSDLTETSQGWPIALCIHRNVRDQRASHELAQEITSNWIETRLWGGLSKEDQQFVLDIGLFEWIDPELVDAALGAGSAQRVRSIPALAGLLRSVGGESGSLSLHPLIRQYCAAKRLRETPDRYRSIHAAIADGLASQGQVLAGMRHATEAGDPRQVGQILIDAGGFRVWLRHGLTRLRLSNELLTTEVLALFPRLVLVRCMELTMRGDFEAAMSAYFDLGARTEGFTRNWDGSDDPDLSLDHLCFRWVLATCGCWPINTPDHRELLSEVRSLADSRDVGPLERGAGMYATGNAASHQARFDQALDWLRRARAELAGGSWYLTMYVDLQLGNIAMVQGRVAEARETYARAQRAAKADFFEDAGPSVIAEVLMTELSLERNKPAPLARRSHKVPLLAKSGAWLTIYLPACEAAMELVKQEDGPDEALRQLDELINFARTTSLATLVRCLAAMRVSLLVAAGRETEAQRVWTRAGFPSEASEIVDVDNQTWREMEAISCAGVRLLTAQSRLHDARRLAEALLGISRKRRLRRTEMRGLALAMVLEQRAGNAADARRHLLDYLHIYAETDYVRALIADRQVVLGLLDSLASTELDEEVGILAEAVRRVLANEPSERTTDAAPVLTPRECDILQRLDTCRDKEIASALDLSEDGVRYHNKKIFKKLGVRSRLEATQRARSMGILPMVGVPAGEPSTGA